MPLNEKIYLKCRNCGKKWMEIRPEGYLVRYIKNNNFLVNRNDPDDKKLFRCPRCGKTKKIKRLARPKEKLHRLPVATPTRRVD